MILREISGPDLLSGLFCSAKFAVFFFGKIRSFFFKNQNFPVTLKHPAKAGKIREKHDLKETGE